MIDLTDGEKDAVWVLGRIMDLEDAGLVKCLGHEDGHRPLTPKGLAIYDQIKADGYRVSKAKVKEIVAANAGGQDYSEELAVLITCREI